MRRIRSATGVLLAALLSTAAAPGAVSARIVYPPQKSLLKGEGKLEILGFRPSAAGRGRIVAMGASGSSEYDVAAGLFRVPVKLAPGKTSLQLDGENVELFLSAAGAPEAGFELPDVHAVDNGCEECHRIEKDKLPLLEPGGKLCLRCHDDVTKIKGGEAVVHPPAAEGDCFACHKFHGPSIRQLSPAARRGICFECHDNFAESKAGGKKLTLHRPVERGECTGCHNPHAAAQKKLLPAVGNALCLKCHKDPAKTPEGKEWTFPHAGLDDGCSTCHLVHVSEAKRLLKKPQAALCFDCHDNFTVKKAGPPMYLHPPVEEGDCSGCHRPHGSGVKKLLAAAPEKALCLTCHDDPGKSPKGEDWAVPHPALDDGCPSCHVPHGSSTPRLLKKAQAPLCFDCHDNFLAGAAGKGLLLHQPVVRGECVRCHLPHGSQEKKLLAAPAQKPLCLLCHKDPANTPEGREWPVAHPALDDGCPACHLPHAAVVPRLLKSAQGPLCAACHEDKNLGPDGAEWADPHPPVKKGMCASCHGPHGATQKALLAKPGNDLCQTCHKEVHERHRTVEVDSGGRPSEEKAVVPGDFPVNRSGVLGCTGCHRPHGSQNPRLWNLAEQEFCGQCHKKY